MNRRLLYLIIALLTFAAGVFTTAQVNRAAHYIWPDVDPQPKAVVTIRCGTLR